MIELDESKIRSKLTKALSQHEEDHPKVALLYLDLGDSYEIKGKFREAEREYHKAASIFEALGVDHELLLAIAIKSAAEMARIQNKFDAAIKLKLQARQLVKAYCDRDFGIEPDGTDAA